MTLEMSSNQEDYLESIYKIIHQKEAVRVKDIAEDLGVRNPSVTSALQTLSREGLINYEPYGVITLTETGRRRAFMIYQKHCVIQDFFEHVLGIDSDEAARQACLMEHGMNDHIFKRVIQLMRLLFDTDHSGMPWQEFFTRYCEGHDVDLADPDAVQQFIRHGSDQD